MPPHAPPARLSVELASFSSSPIATQSERPRTEDKQDDSCLPSASDDSDPGQRELVDLGDGLEEVVIVEFGPNDVENPRNFSALRKASILLAVTYVMLLSSVSATSVGVMSEWGTVWFGVSPLEYEITLTIYLVPMALASLVLAPLSELYGRTFIYRTTTIITALCFLPQIFSHSYALLLVSRCIQGMASAVGNSLVGGTIADMYRARQRGVAMNVMALANYTGNSLGGAVFGWVGMKCGIQWCYGIQALAAVVSVILNFVLLKETRADAILASRARQLTKVTGIKHVCASELQSKNMKAMLKVSVIRPLQYLMTEPIVSAMSLWIGFAWSCIYLGSSSTLTIFGQYGWNSGLTGLSLLCTLVGGILGFISNFHQEYIYSRARKSSPTGSAAPEVRLYWAASGGLLFPLCMFAYAWTGTPRFHWIVPAIFLSGAMWGVFIMYSGVFNYFADAYETYSSSAQAAQSFVRNTLSGTLPLATHALYSNLGFPQASTLVASISTALAAAPIALIIFGPKLRARSKAAVAIARTHID